jgi:hypothetical protein
MKDKIKSLFLKKNINFSNLYLPNEQSLKKHKIGIKK